MCLKALLFSSDNYNKVRCGQFPPVSAARLLNGGWRMLRGTPAPLRIPLDFAHNRARVSD